MRVVTSKDGVIYQVEKHFQGFVDPVIVDICYSAGENGELEFEWATVEEGTNSEFSADHRQMCNKQLENGIEEDIVRELVTIYEGSSITFLPNHYSF